MPYRRRNLKKKQMGAFFAVGLIFTCVAISSVVAFVNRASGDDRLSAFGGWLMKVP